MCGVRCGAVCGAVFGMVLGVVGCMGDMAVKAECTADTDVPCCCIGVGVRCAVCVMVRCAVCGVRCYIKWKWWSARGVKVVLCMLFMECVVCGVAYNRMGGMERECRGHISYYRTYANNL